MGNNGFFSAVKGLFNHIALAMIGEVAYEELMKYFIAHKSDDDAIVKGALLKETADDGITVITQVFLDKENNVVCAKNGIPLGRRLKTSSLDDELLAVFKDAELVIFD
jgi:hypothetical protein